MLDNDNWRTSPLYTYQEAAHLAKVSPSTVRNWLLGYSTKRGDIAPLFTYPSQKENAMVSFIELIEIVVAATFRKAEKIPFQTVRKAYDNARKEFNVEYPFAHFNLAALGGHIVHSIREEKGNISRQTLDSLEQWSLPLAVTDILSTFDYLTELVNRWYPVGKEIPIVIDPRISTGLPTIIERGVTVSTIHKRFKLGQHIDFISQDFEIDKDIIEEAIRYADTVPV
ncbi:MAG: DUF433 domain-containing protein [Dehalococcoidales bacterium]|nr:DUF433 domain-containing protein [Dehalococcoidales bacterium]